MTEPPLIARQRTLLRELTDLVAERTSTLPALHEGLQSSTAAEESAYAEGMSQLEEQFTASSQTLDRQLEETRTALQARLDAEQDAALKGLSKARWHIKAQYEADREAAENAFQEARWAADALLEGTKGEVEGKLRENNSRVENWMEKITAVGEAARAQLKAWKQPIATLEEQARREAAAEGKRPFRKLTECLAELKGDLEELQELSSPAWVKGVRIPLLAVLTWLVLLYPLGWLVVRLTKMNAGLPGLLAVGAAAGAAIAAIAGCIAYTVLVSAARKAVAEIFVPLCQTLDEAEATRKHLQERYAAECKELVTAAEKKHQRDHAQARTRHQEQLAAAQKRLDSELYPVEGGTQSRRQTAAHRHAAELRAAEERHAQAVATLRRRHEAEVQALQGQYNARLTGARSRAARSAQALEEAWRKGVATAKTTVAEINRHVERLFPRWDQANFAPWVPPEAPPPALRFGEYRVRLNGAPAGKPPELVEFTLPALCPFPEHSSLLIRAQDEGRDRAIEILRAAMFRLVTALPAGKVRFVIVDPVGLGENFATFMHLADYDELMVASRIWTETPHIEQRLTDLTAHMENVIQKYLRDRYPTINDYNREAGEVAEPFRILVVANFPANFSEEAIRRLVSIAQTGARCGVSMLISVDSRLPLPKGFDLADLERAGATLVWKEGRFQWKDEDFGRYPLTLDAPPGGELAGQVLKQVGEGSRNARRVEVPFEFIAPTPNEWWTGDSRKGISVALGRAGATKRQHLRLGQGTSQHAVIAGKTGSGKSTLLHALITNLALMYSPDEVELYLIDFKKGVEFKTYATHHLPHARIIAIESEREFGLSVLQRLDAELKARGEKFRAAQAQDVNGFRQARPNEPMPRILLVVDEFQEFFTEDDRVAQDASQLLDRLVRQGRAFGMHVMLGSQTLGGAYSLARSTIDQMAVRIALQCSEADAHLILSAENSAARLLTRPGEAIYNDANGLVEGNNPFQVVWLGEERREQYLARLADLAKRRRLRPREMIVFEGNAPADVSRNHLLGDLLRNGSRATAAAKPRAALEGRAWLGDALAINDMTAAVFRRQNGSNLLVVGQQAETALGMLTTAVIGLAAQMRALEPAGRDGVRFYLVDGGEPSAPTEGLLARLRDVLPQGVRVLGWKETPAVLAELSAEMERRQQANDTEAPGIYLVIHGLQRCRDLRKGEDDYTSFMRKEEKASPTQQFGTLLREGPPLGIHTLVWCDTLTNLQRSLDRQGLREMALRVAFQMNVADSSNLIDNPQASRLGLHRALFSSEEEGRLEKFRPYGLPSDEWLEEVRRQLRGGASGGAGAVASGKAATP